MLTFLTIIGCASPPKQYKFKIGELVVHVSNNHFPMVVHHMEDSKFFCKWLNEYGDPHSGWYNDFELVRSSKNEIPMYKYRD